MNTLRKKLLLCSAVISIASFTFLASAEERSLNACNDQANKEECMHAQLEKRFAEHETKLHDALKLSAAQEPAWKSFTESNHQQLLTTEADHKIRPSPADLEKMSAPEQLQSHLTMMQKQLAMMQNHLSALNTFYATLSSEQQQTMNTEMNNLAQHHHRYPLHDSGHQDPHLDK